MRRLPLLAIPWILASCGGGSAPGACGGGPSLEILAPAEGDRVAAANVELTIHACQVDLADRIVVELLQPFETDYAFVMTDDSTDSTITTSVPVLPGTMEFRARTEDGTVQSASVTIEGAPP